MKPGPKKHTISDFLGSNNHTGFASKQRFED
jgi:hypothetical protein